MRFLINIETEVITAILAQDDINTASAFFDRGMQYGCITPSTVTSSDLRQRIFKDYSQHLVLGQTTSLGAVPFTVDGKIETGITE